MSAMTLVFVVPGALVYLVVGTWVVWLFTEPRSSNWLDFGCTRCDWAIANPRRRRWWTLQPQFRWHCVRVHHDWPPLFTRSTRTLKEQTT